MGRQTRELFSIGEVAKLFHISVGLLRHYDKIGLLKPEYTDEASGYRYYSVRQFECLNTIRYLRALDMPLPQITSYLDSRDTDKIYEMLENQKRDVERRREQLRIVERKIENRLEQIRDALNSRLDEICIAEIPERRMTFLKTEVKPETYLDLEYSIRKLEQEEQEAIIFLGKVGVGISKEKLELGQYQVYDRVFVVLDEEDCVRGESVVLPPERCVTVRFQGTHRQAERYYVMLMDYMRKRGLRPSGFSKEITMIDEGMTRDPGKFVTEIQIPV